MCAIADAEGNRIFMPDTLKEDLIEWYHVNLSHPRGDRMHLTMKLYFYWKGMKNEIMQKVKHCDICQS